jgi:hypothetical protein
MSIFLIDIKSKPAILIHVPKTGGSSVRHGRQCSEARLYEPDPDWRALPAFAMLRNPRERLESAWHDFRFQRRMTDMPFPDFVEWVEQALKNVDAIADPRTIEHHVAPMVHPVHGLRYATFFGLTSSLQADFDEFCRRFEYERVVLPKLRSSHGLPDAQWTTHALHTVMRVYKHDFDFMRAMGYEA